MGMGIGRSKAGSFGRLWLAGGLGSNFATPVVPFHNTLKQI
jgi:hypothetical protein